MLELKTNEGMTDGWRGAKESDVQRNTLVLTDNTQLDAVADCRASPSCHFAAV